MRIPRIVSLSLTVVGVATAVWATGCAKLKTTEAQKQADLVNLLGKSLQLYAPDNSYSVRNVNDARPFGDNVRQLMNVIINPIASSLKESELHLSQTIAEGARTNDSLTISNKGLGSELSGTRTDSTGVVNWAYKLNSISIFTGSQSLQGGSGDFNFNNTALGPAISVHFDTRQGVPTAASGASSGSSSSGFVRHLTVLLGGGSATYLAFTFTFTTSIDTPSKVELTGKSSGSDVSGSWDTVNGGWFKTLNGKYCFNSALQDVTDPNVCN